MALTWPSEREGKPSPGPLGVEPFRTIQFLLRQHGATSLIVDGIYGPITTAAVESFQTEQGVVSDGVVGNLTWPKLIVQVKTGSQGEAVKAVQGQFQARNLSGDPSKGLKIDGDFGPKTNDAVRGFQQSDGLTVDGIVGPVTWNALVNGALAQ